MQQESEYGHQWHCPEKSIVHEANMHSAGGRDGKINIGIAGLTLTAIENAETNKLLNTVSFFVVMILLLWKEGVPR